MTCVLFAPLLLLACGGADPVADNAATPSDNLVGDASATGLAAPGNSSAAELAQKAALPPASEGLGWSHRAPDRIAEFGPPGSPAFSIQCQVQREGPKQLVFIRYLPPSAGGQATLSFTGNGQAASLPVAAVVNPDGIGGHWRAAVQPNEHARDVAEAFAGPATVEISVSGTPPLVVPTGGAPRQVLTDCLR
jgi:hypothetical protein